VFVQEDNKFDEIVGVLTEILMDDEFIHLQTKFCQENCGKWHKSRVLPPFGADASFAVDARPI
jgi:hypothetical protein